MLSAQLESNLRSHAFDEYLGGAGGGWGEGSETEAVENLFALVHEQALADLSRPEENGQQQQQSSSSKSKSRGARSHTGVGVDPSAGGGSVLGLSWSCNGSVLAASYGRSDHVGWCNHSSSTLAFWNIMRRQIDARRPDFTLDTECCCMCIAYHPERPTIIAGGMFNGEIRVWDTSLLETAQAGAGAASAAEDDNTAASASSTASGASGASSSLAADAGNPLLMRSRIDDYFHREPIARLEWVRDPLSRVWSLVSVAGDGKVLFWSLESDNKLRFPTEGYTLSPSDRWDGHHHDALGMGGSRNKFHVLGGTAVTFGPQTMSSGGGGMEAGSSAGSGGAAHYFVAATEGGGLVRVSLSILPKRKGYLAKGAGGDPSLKWSREAHRFLENSDPSTRFELRKSVERFVKSSGGPGGNSPGDTVELDHIFLSRPPATQLYPSASSAVSQSFEAHAGPIYGLAFNCFDKRIFASASTDGRIKVFQINHVRRITETEAAGRRRENSAAGARAVGADAFCVLFCVLPVQAPVDP